MSSVMRLAEFRPIVPSTHPVKSLVFNCSELLLRPSIATVFLSSPPLTEVFVDTILHAFVAAWPKRSKAQDRTRSTSGPVRRALAWIQANFSGRVNIADIAAAARTSTRNLQKLFREELSATPSEYLKNLRLERFHAVLCDPTIRLSVSEVAAQSGLPRKSEYEKQYKKRFGVSPSQTRNASRRLPSP
jgi:transcriptional regulator GlxA family with amidase domain